MVTVGATLAMCTVAVALPVRPPSSVTRTVIAGDAGPSSPAAENVTFCPGVSNVPSPSRSQAYESAPPSGSEAEPDTDTDAPSATAYGPPAPAVGGSLNVIRTTDGSWSLAWTANSEFTWTTSNVNGRPNSASLERMWSSVWALPSKSYE